MTDQEITRIIAEKVMGADGENWFEDCDGLTVYLNNFFPLEKEQDCMAAWDRFSEGRHTILRRHGKHSWVAGTVSQENPWELANNSMEIDRRRAMCECMVKAVAE